MDVLIGHPKNIHLQSLGYTLNEQDNIFLTLKKIFLAIKFFLTLKLMG